MLECRLKLRSTWVPIINDHDESNDIKHVPQPPAVNVTGPHPVYRQQRRPLRQSRDLQKAFFQHASRADKGVSAARMVISLKMLNEPRMVESICGHLPAEIRVQSIKRVTKNFNSKNNCIAST